MNIYFVRHANTVENQKGIRQGQSLGTTSALGQEQNKRVGERLKEMEFDLAFVSDLDRTKDTASAILSHHPKVPVNYEPLLRERSAGVFEGLPKWQYEKAQLEHHEGFANFKPEGGESMIEVQERGLLALEKIKKTKAKNVLVVSHAAIMSTIFLHFVNKELSYNSCEMYSMHNTGITLVEFTDSSVKIKSYDKIDHLT